jgi:hypothetical protein
MIRMKKLKESPEELDKPYDYQPVSTGVELRAAFLGEEQEMIVSYLRKQKNPRGVVLPHLILYFCYRYGLMSQRRLMRRLKHLIKMNSVEVFEESGLVFYRIKKESPE